MLCRCLHEQTEHGKTAKACHFADCECSGYHPDDSGSFALLAFTFADGAILHEYRFWIDTRLGINVNNYRDYFHRLARKGGKKAESCGYKSWLIRYFADDGIYPEIKITDL